MQKDQQMEINDVSVGRNIHEFGERLAQLLLAQRKDGDTASRISLELIGEIVLLIAIAAFFIYMFVGSLSWDKGATIMPRIIILLGIPFWLLRVWAIVRPKKQKSASSNIMDTGFYIHQDPKMAMAGFIRITGFLILLYLGIWLFGFHVALPVGLFLYLLRYGQMGWLGAMIVGLVFLAVIIGVYDYVIEINWDTPLVLQLFGRS